MGPVSSQPARETIALLKKQVAEQEARLATYKETLEEIYALYDTRIEDLSLIRRLSDSLRVSLDLKKVCLDLTTVVMEELAPDGSLLLLLNRQGRLRLKASARGGEPAAYWPDQDPIQGQVPRVGQGPLGEVVATKRPLLLPRLEASEGLLAEARSLVCLPLIARGEILGVFALIGLNPGAFGQGEVRVLTIICDQAAAGLYNVRLINKLRQVNRVLRRSERQATQARESLERLLENANDLILTLDSQGRITYVNRQAGGLGFEPEELVGQPASVIIDSPGPDPVLIHLAEIGPVQELSLKDASGESRTALVSFTPLPPAGQEEPMVLVIARDITERKQLERQLLHSEKLASVGLLAAGVAHEIGNPLSAILGYAQILKKIQTVEESGSEYLAAIEEQAGRIERIIQELLAYSRPASGQPNRLKINEAVDSILKMLTNQKLFRGVEVVTEFDPAEPEIFMDRDLLAQVVVNLVVNAAQALNNAGAISVSTRMEDDRITLRVADDGPGVSPEAAGRIFDPFFTTKPVGQGTGLGLSICHRIVENEGGSIILAEAAGPGAVFEVALPRVEEGD